MKKAEMGPSDDKDFFTFSMHLGSRWSCARKPYCSLAVTGHAMKFVSEIDYLSENIFVAHYFDNCFIVLDIFQTKTSYIYWFQLLKYNSLQLFFVIYKNN